MNTMTLAQNAAAQNLFDNLFGDLEGTCKESFTPAVDVIEEDGAYVMRMDLPGIAREDVKLEMKDDTLTVSGARKAPEVKKESKNYRYCETGYGEFSRSFSLPESIDHEKIGAKLENGVLEIRLALKPEVGPRSIQIA